MSFIRRKNRPHDPLRLPSLLEPAKDLLDQGQFDDAMALVRDHLEMWPDQPAALFLECQILARDCGAQQADGIYRGLAKIVNPHFNPAMRELRHEIRAGMGPIKMPQFQPNREQGEIATDFSQPPANDF